jgi:hypothetical protein
LDDNEVARTRFKHAKLAAILGESGIDIQAHGTNSAQEREVVTGYQDVPKIARCIGRDGREGVPGSYFGRTEIQA